MLAGSDDMLDMAREALEKQLRSLVAAGLVSNEVEAWRACMHRLRLLTYHTLQWYLERKAAVIAVGGTQDDILGVFVRQSQHAAGAAQPAALAACQVRMQQLGTGTQACTSATFILPSQRAVM